MTFISRLISIACVVLTVVLIYVYFWVQPLPRPCLQAVRPGDAERFGFRPGDAEVPETYKTELRRRCEAAQKGGGR